MAARIRRTKEQIANELQLKLSKVKSEMKDEVRAAETQRAIILGKTIQGMAAAGHANAKLVYDEILSGLKRKQDRFAFGLEPLPEPEPDDQQPVNPPLVVPPKPAGPVDVQARLDRALTAWKAAEGSPRDVLEPLRVELGQAIAGIERVSGQLWSGLRTKEDRDFYGLTDRPGELARAS
jgi:hypothetical protein